MYSFRCIYRVFLRPCVLQGLFLLPTKGCFYCLRAAQTGEILSLATGSAHLGQKKEDFYVCTGYGSN